MKPTPPRYMFSLLAMALTGLVASACQVEAASEEDQGSLEGDPGQIFSISAVQDFALTIDETDFAKMSAEMKIVEAHRDFEHMLLPRTKGKGTFTYGTTTLPVEVKVKGMYSAQSFDHKPSLSIDFKGESFLGLKNLTLNAMTQDATMVHEMLAYRMYEAVAVPVPRIGYSRVSVNGQALGVYVTLEAIDKTFLTRKFGSDQGILYEGVYGGDVRKEDVGTMKLEHTSGKTNPQEDVDHAKLNELVAAVESRGEDLFFGDTALIETDAFLNMMAMAYIIGDWDNYISANNYRLHRHPTTGRWSVIPTGVDQTFTTSLLPFRPYADKSFPVLFKKCLSVTRCATAYYEALKRANAAFTAPDGTLSGTMTRRIALVDPAAAADTRKPYDAGSIEKARRITLELIQRRPAEIAKALECTTTSAAGVAPCITL